MNNRRVHIALKVTRPTTLTTQTSVTTTNTTSTTQTTPSTTNTATNIQEKANTRAQSSQGNMQRSFYY